MTEHEKKARDLFLSGANCSQAVAGAFEDLVDLDLNTLYKVSSSFGGGMGRLREVCGAVSGMQLILGLLEGYSDFGDKSLKTKHYSKVQNLAHDFEKIHGSIVCKNILNLKGPDIPEPSERTPEFYQTRPCLRCVCDAARILDEYLERNVKSNED